LQRLQVFLGGAWALTVGLHRLLELLASLLPRHALRRRGDLPELLKDQAVGLADGVHLARAAGRKLHQLLLRALEADAVDVRAVPLHEGVPHALARGERDVVALPGHDRSPKNSENNEKSAVLLYGRAPPGARAPEDFSGFSGGNGN